MLQHEPIATGEEIVHVWGCDVDRSRVYGQPIDPKCNCGTFEEVPPSEPKKLRNPYRAAETVGNVIKISGVVAILSLFFYVLVSAGYANGMGWWALLLVPGVPIGLMVLQLIALVIGDVFDNAAKKWRNAKLSWDERRDAYDA